MDRLKLGGRMKHIQRSLIILFSIFLLTLIVSCSGGSGKNNDSSDSTNVTLNLGSRSGGKVLSAIPSNVVEIKFTISSPEAVLITRTVNVVGLTSITETFEVPNGPSRTFKVEAFDINGYVVFEGSATTDLDGKPITVAVQMSVVVPPPSPSDTTPPTITMTGPANGATGVAVNSVVTAAFNEPVDPSTITTTSFTLYDSLGYPVSGVITYAGGLATFTPIGNLTAGTTYTAIIDITVKDLAGNAMAADYVWTFKTVSYNAYAWGDNGYGQLGNGTNINSTTPVQVSGLTDVVSIGGGYDIEGGGHSLAVKSDGTAWAWGANWQGQLGDGTSNESNVPVQVANLGGVKAVSGGADFSLALQADGTAWAWGYGWLGQLGDGNGTDSLLPVQVDPSTGLTNATAISAGHDHGMALNSDGTVWAWGSGWNGQLGDDTGNDSLVPVQALVSGITAIDAGAYHSLALQSDGTVWAWGDNWYGQLGDGNTLTTSLFPVQVDQSTGLTGVTAIAAGDYHNLALKTDGTVWAWGANGNGQLGDGNYIDSPVPVQVPGLTGVTAIAAGRDHSLALKSDGTVWAWGYNWNGQIGDGTNNNSTVPVQVSGLSGAAFIGAGNYHSLALSPNPVVDLIAPYITSTDPWDWASGVAPNSIISIGFSEAVEPATITTSTIVIKDSLNNIVTGSVNYSGGIATFTPSALLKYNETYTATVTTGVMDFAGHNMAADYVWTFTTGTMYVWTVGWNTYGQLGLGTTAVTSWPTKIAGFANTVSADGGYQHSIAAKSDGTVWAWGFNSSGQLGDGTTFDSSPPVQVTGLTGAKSVSGGYFHSLALKSDGTVWAWGENVSGQLGNSTNTPSSSPVQVTGLTGAIDVSAGQEFSLAAKSDGTAWAWGFNGDGELGNGTLTNSNAPVQVLGLTGVSAVSAGKWHGIALKSDGTVWAWGDNFYGQLGNGTNIDSNAPVQVSGLTGVIAISAGDFHNLALKSDGTVWAWGENSFGQLGDVTNISKNAPVQVSGLIGATKIAAGTSHSAAIYGGGYTTAWGRNNYGQLGNANTTDYNAPTFTYFSYGAAMIAAGGYHTMVILPY